MKSLRWVLFSLSTMLLVVMIGSWLVSGSLRVNAQTDTGAVVVTGSVPPKSSSITTDFAVDATGTVNQGQELTYTLTYGSSNPASIPLTFGIEWDQGTVDGATEPTVNSLEYVIGSASTGFGGVSPIIDLANRRITWTVPSFPGNTQNQTVQFKLRTTGNYSGPREVTMPVRSFFASPVGVPERQVVTTFRYFRSDPAASPAPSPSLSPTPTPVADPSLISDSVQITAISIPSLGAGSAKIRVRLAGPAGLQLRYGLNANRLSEQLELSEPRLEQEFILTQLQPQTNYFFQLRDNQDRVVSDVFTFTTSARGGQLEGAARITVTQDRTALYFGPVTGTSGDEYEPIITTEDSVIDISLEYPESDSIRAIEVYLQNPAVLGVTTDLDPVDELQSQGTRLNRVGRDLYIGKVRVPPQRGEYQVMGRVEDIYGNITEQELQLLRVIPPLRVLDEKTKQPIEYARAFFYLYDSELRLYQPLSNVTSSIQNPGYANKQGFVNVNLFPARYRVEISMPGYQSRAVEFEIIPNKTDSYPVVLLTPNRIPVIGWLQQSYGAAQQLFDENIRSILSLTNAQAFYRVTLILTVIAIFLMVGVTIVAVAKPELSFDSVMLRYWKNPTTRILIFVAYAGMQWLRFLIEILIAHSIVVGSVYFFSFDPDRGIVLLAAGGLLIGLWAFTLFLTKYRQLKCCASNHCDD